MILKLVRNALGYTIAGIDILTRPRKLKRSKQKQQQVDSETAQMALYQFFGCPFCIKTRRAIHRLNLNIECRDANSDNAFRKELLEQGGKIQVPCLKITNDDGNTTWLYESGAIIEHLESQFGAAA
ncbi:glutathione S-transferase N-terminal domain-containing protein [Parendozoicomonas sp. Alg238-R29]|uniref:glutaredoxin family protein n=1 Tax=Parendozoicomonas sp. Alg238-R29 TaxID=2993446 RepID=UPI00248EA057|nr:glutathione S-transferase N-terminal domain-containing protein [Parendozoicomonas sp. Alg238-R29]